MPLTRDEILASFKKEISLIRGKIYTFNIDTIDSSNIKQFFYFTTVPPDLRVNAFDGVVTNGVSVSKEIISDPTLSPIPVQDEEDVYHTQWTNFTQIPFIPWTESERPIDYNMEGMFIVDNSQTTAVSLKYVEKEIPVGYFYRVEYMITSVVSGQIVSQLGSSTGTPQTSDGTYVDILDTTNLEGGTAVDFMLTVSSDFQGRIVYISLQRIGACSETMTFTPNYNHADTLYYASSAETDMGSKVHILNERGPLFNVEERYYTLGINQTNRTYAPIMKSDPQIVRKFLIDGLPGGLFKNVFNRPPEGTVAADRPTNIYYDSVNGDKTVSLSGLISDPEDDTLNYRWTHFAPQKTMDGVSLLTSFEDPQSLETDATLIVPPTDMIYTLHLEVADSDNVTTIPINVKVSGIVEFDSWSVGISGINTFDLGDSNVPFDDLD